jgi:hypothetical protein
MARVNRDHSEQAISPGPEGAGGCFFLESPSEISPLAQGGEGLGAMWGEEKTREYLRKAGFRDVKTNQLAHDIQNNWYVARK